MKILKLFVIVFFLSSCSQIDIKHYENMEPQFNFFDYFLGETKGWGVVQDRRGVVTRQFVVDIVGTRNNDSLTLVEDFIWNDGEQTQRIWNLKQVGEHDFIGIANDVDGTASGSTYGNALHWKYYLFVDVDGTKWKVHLDDWMFLQPDGILINKTKMSKFGFYLGEITIVFNNIPPVNGEPK